MIMAKYSVETTTIGEIVNTPELVEIAERLQPGILKTPGLSLALKMTLPQAAKFVPNVLTPELLEKVEEEFAKLG
jgi:hypothetical protein